MVNRQATSRYSETAYSIFESILQDSLNWPIKTVLDPFLDEQKPAVDKVDVKTEQEDITMDTPTENQTKVAILSSSLFSWSAKASFDALTQGFVSGAKKYGLFSNHDLVSDSFIIEIVGTFCYLGDLELRRDFISTYPILPLESISNDEMDVDLTEESKNQNTPAQLLPPFVFPVPSLDLFLDARDVGNFDGRFVRSCCDASLANAELRLVVKINPSEVSDPSKIKGTKTEDEEEVIEMKIQTNERFKLCIFTTKSIPKGQEIILANSTGDFHLFPCNCTDSCQPSESIQKIEEFRRLRFEGSPFLLMLDIEIPHIPYFDLLQKQEDERQSFVNKEHEELQQVPTPWVYSSLKILQEEMAAKKHVEYVEIENDIVMELVEEKDGTLILILRT